MRRKAKVWLKGLFAAAISGAANGLTTGLAATTIAPDTFNMAEGLVPVLKLVVASAAVAAISGAASYLKQSPIPSGETQDIVPTPALVAAAEAPKEPPLTPSDRPPGAQP